MNVSRTSLRWLPAIVVPAVVVVGALAVPLQAGAAVDLPDKTPEQVLLMVSDSTVTAFSGTIEQTSDLGLPNLDLGSGMPGSEPGSGSGSTALSTALELATGSHTARVFVDGPENVRVQIKDRLAERNAISNGTDAWFYDSETDVATHLAIPGHDQVHDQRTDLAPTGLVTPAQVADRFLSEIDPSTSVSVGTDGTVAGRTAYELLLTPKTTDTLVASVSISVDAETGLPLRVTVRATGQEAPAARIGFTTVDFATPAAELFTFSPPPGATVEEQEIPGMPDHKGATPEAAMPQPIITGSGWSSVMELPAGTVPAELLANPLVSQLATAVDGGRILSTALVNVLVTTDGRVFAGSVPVATLQAAAQ